MSKTYWLALGVRVHENGRHSPILRNQVDVELPVSRRPSRKRMQRAAHDASQALYAADLAPGKPAELDLLWAVKRAADRASHQDQALQDALEKLDDEYTDPEEC